jgi:diguanylate cyclase (GGDEF)-like protein/PAS domain S-box-containing protein
MLARLYSFKVIIGAALLWLGALAYGLAIYSTQVYRDHTIDTQLNLLQSQLKHESHEVTWELYDRLRLYALQLNSEDPFKQALGNRDRNTLEAWLAQSYTRYKLSHEKFKLNAILVRDLSGEVFARSADDGLGSYTGCAEVLKSIGGSLTRLVKPMYSLCSFGNRLLSEVLVPVGYPEPRAYLHIIADASEGLRHIEDKVRMPISVVHGSGEILYRSSEWIGQDLENYLYPAYKLYGDDAFLGATVSAAFDQEPLVAGLENTKSNFLIITSIATIAAMVLVLLMLNQAFMPMNKLRNSVGALLTGKYAPIGDDKLPEELRDLVVAYNEMVEGLEIETISRRNIEEKLRAEKDFISTTLDSITNPVIVVDSRECIKLLNPSAEKLFGSKQDELYDCPISELLILYSNRKATRIIDITQLLNRKLSLSSMFFFDASQKLVELEFSASPMIDMVAEDVGFVIILKDVSESRKLRRKLSYEGSHDQLTGFLNRSAFETKFETLVTEYNDAIPQHVLAYLDIDQFRLVNETCGSAAGDLLLKQVSSMIKKHVRQSDIVSRFSGDEFGIMMPFFEMDRALQTIQKIIIEIQHSVFAWNEHEYRVTASIGVMAFGRMNDEYADSYSRVSTACFLAKQNGGNQYNYIDENDEKVMAQQVSMEWVSAIMKGLTDDHFCLYVQPIVSIDDKHRHAHYEVLIRYRGPDGEIVPPDEFLPPAERYNLIERIDSWVVSNVIAWLQENPQLADQIMFSINLSGRSIGSQTFHNFLRKTLIDSGVSMSSLCFEITETAVVDNVERSVEFISSIKQLGVKFSLDDFGTGLSSFSYLKQFPVDYLKIDGEFVRDIIEDDKSYVFVRSMTEVGHCLDMEVIAEFVESDTMFDKLREADVDYVQGYTIGKPVPIDSLVKLHQEVKKQAG